MGIGVDSALMRTCRRIYAETLPVLYGENTFLFKNVHMLKKFRNTGLVQTQGKSSNVISHIWAYANTPIREP